MIEIPEKSSKVKRREEKTVFNNIGEVSISSVHDSYDAFKTLWHSNRSQETRTFQV